MFLNKWTIQLNCPGELVEKAFDSEEELFAYVNGMKGQHPNGAMPTVSVINPDGKQELLAPLSEELHR